MIQELLHFNEEVKIAIQTNQPIVALESSTISHNMTYLENIETAKNIEDIIRAQGAVPATIAIHQGKIHIGINEEIMLYLAQSKQTIKASRRDLSYMLSQNLTASTTMAASICCAHLAKLTICVTGGISGAYPHANERFDTSLLTELSSTPITVVCSGAKSILDLPKTLDMLETYNVPVIGYQTNEFPAFYNHSNAIPLVHRLNNAQDIAQMMMYQHKLTLPNGIIIANPIHKSAEIPDDQIRPMIKQAQQDVGEANSKAITPCLLHRIAELTADQSIHANIELIKNNAILGSKIAIAYKKIQEQSITPKSLKKSLIYP